MSSVIMASVLLCSLFLLSSEWFILLGKSSYVVGSPPAHPIVTTTYGPIQGYATQINGIKHLKFAQVFLGIPYAKPPVGSLRFEKPQPHDPWNSVKPTINFGNKCAGYSENINGSEDCLTLNVFAPIKKNDDTKLYPVYFYIHGGAFSGGNSTEMGNDSFLTNVVARDIVGVSINYRLGPLGFLFTDLPGQTPNVGILDQIQALKWVRDNIDRFGGDPKRVTLSGESAGGASVSWITMSSLSRGLYAQTFPMSGSALDIWASKPDVVKRNTKELISLAKCQFASDVLGCLRAIPLHHLMSIAFKNIRDRNSVDFGRWHPVFHSSLVGTKVETIAQAIESSPVVPHLASVASQEKANNATNITQNTFEHMLRISYGHKSIFGNRTSKAADSIVKFYTKEAKTYLRYPWTSAIVQSKSDVLFVIGEMREAIHRAKAGAPVYFFLNECVKFDTGVVAGCPHGYTINYLSQNDTDIRIRKKILPKIIRFIKTGEPWIGHRVNFTSIPFFHASITGGFSDSLWPERVQFWNEFYNTFGFDWPSGSRDKP